MVSYAGHPAVGVEKSGSLEKSITKSDTGNKRKPSKGAEESKNWAEFGKSKLLG